MPLLLESSPHLTQAAAAPSGLVPPSATPFPFPERPPPSSSFLSLPPVPSFAFSFLGFQRHRFIIATQFFLSPYPAPGCPMSPPSESSVPVCPLQAQSLLARTAVLGRTRRHHCHLGTVSNFLTPCLHPAPLLRKHHSSPFLPSRLLWVTGHMTHCSGHSGFTSLPAAALLCVPAKLPSLSEPWCLTF